MKGKEPMDLTSFSEDDYAANLVDKEGYSEESAKMMAKKKKESLSAAKIEIDLRSLSKADEFEHLSPEERKKRQKDREKRQKDRAKHRADRQKQHEEVEAGIPEDK